MTIQIINLLYSDSYTYILNNDTIFTNFTTGTVEIACKAISTYENGWPTILVD